MARGRRTRSSPSGPARLVAGDLVGVVAPGFAVDRRALAAGMRSLEALGFRVRPGRHVAAQRGYLAGTDEQRAADLNAMAGDPEVRAVWFARGGFGAARLIDQLSPAALDTDKLWIGYSDATALFARLAGSRATCIWGPHVAELAAPHAWHRGSLLAALDGAPLSLKFPRRSVLHPGRARGPLVGGTLSVLAHLCGTPHFPAVDGALLLLEDVGEETYRLDRMLTQLGQAGVLRRAAGIVLGAFRIPRRVRFPPDRRLAEVLREHLLPLRVPVVFGLPLGHAERKWSVPLGEGAVLDTIRGRLEFPR